MQEGEEPVSSLRLCFNRINFPQLHITEQTTRTKKRSIPANGSGRRSDWSHRDGLPQPCLGNRINMIPCQRDLIELSRLNYIERNAAGAFTALPYRLAIFCATSLIGGIHQGLVKLDAMFPMYSNSRDDWRRQVGPECDTCRCWIKGRRTLEKYWRSLSLPRLNELKFAPMMAGR